MMAGSVIVGRSFATAIVPPPAPRSKPIKSLSSAFVFDALIDERSVHCSPGVTASVSQSPSAGVGSTSVVRLTM
jgi:hypothetical protein